jgi:hypothetical protein
MQVSQALARCSRCRGNSSSPAVARGQRGRSHTVVVYAAAKQQPLAQEQVVLVDPLAPALARCARASPQPHQLCCCCFRAAGVAYRCSARVALRGRVEQRRPACLERSALCHAIQLPWADRKRWWSESKTPVVSGARDNVRLAHILLRSLRPPTAAAGSSKAPSGRPLSPSSWPQRSRLAPRISSKSRRRPPRSGSWSPGPR